MRCQAIVTGGCINMSKALRLYKVTECVPRDYEVLSGLTIDSDFNEK
jgi:hypothetical protein